MCVCVMYLQKLGRAKKKAGSFASFFQSDVHDTICCLIKVLYLAEKANRRMQEKKGPGGLYSLS